MRCVAKERYMDSAVPIDDGLTNAAYRNVVTTISRRRPLNNLRWWNPVALAEAMLIQVPFPSLTPNGNRNKNSPVRQPPAIKTSTPIHSFVIPALS